MYAPREDRNSCIFSKTVDTGEDESLESKDTASMSVAEICTAPVILPVNTGKKFMSYKVRMPSILSLDGETSIS